MLLPKPEFCTREIEIFRRKIGISLGKTKGLRKDEALVVAVCDVFYCAVSKHELRKVRYV